jgi:hypothetical protein
VRRAIAAVLVIMVSGCLLGPVVDCDDADLEPGLTCEAVIAAARTQLEATPGIRKLTAAQFVPCPPPPAGCPVAPFAVAVHADLADGSQVYVTIEREDDGSLRARSPQPVEDRP